MRMTILTLAAAAALALAGPAAAAAQGPPAHAQGERGKQKAERSTPQGQGQAQGQTKSQSKAQGQAKGQTKAQGQGQAAARPQGQGQARRQNPGQGQGQAARANRGPGNRPAHAGRRGGPAPDPATFNRNLMERAMNARARRHADARDIRVDRQDGRLRVVSRGGDEIFTLSPETVDNLGYWRAAVVPAFREDGYRHRTDMGGIFGRDDRVDYPDDDDRGPPAFCRSGAGHPVWGRDWCLDKGFGLGDDRSAWGIDRDIGDIIFRRPDDRRDILDRGGLADVLGDIVFGRLAVQSLVLGADEPMTGRWIGQTEGPRTLRVTAGDLPVAELVDYDRDDQVDTILFNLGG